MNTAFILIGILFVIYLLIDIIIQEIERRKYFKRSQERIEKMQRIMKAYATHQYLSDDHKKVIDQEVEDVINACKIDKRV